MKRKKKVEYNEIWVKSSVCVLLGIGVIGGVWLKRREEKAEQDLKEIGQALLNEHINELKQKFGYEEIDCQCTLNQIEVVSKKRDEILLRLNYDLVIANEIERDYSTQTWMMRVKHVNAKGYEVIEQGEQLNDL